MMKTTISSTLLPWLPQRIAAASKRCDYELDALLDEIEEREQCLDERHAASGGEATWDEEELVDAVLDGRSAVVDDGDEMLVREVVAHRRELHDDMLLQAVEEEIRRHQAARGLDGELPPSRSSGERSRL